MVTDVIIIGGGAAGLCSAVYLKQKNPKLSVRVLESSPRVCKKLALTGNGRCNISNKNINLTRYHVNDIEFCRYALEKYDLSFTESFFEKIGVPFVFEGDKAFPMGLQAASVVDCLRFAADNLGVIIHLETKATNIQISNGKYKVICDNLSFLAENLIVATGLLSGGERLGCDGGMLNILKKAGFKAHKCTPAIVQIKTETDIVKQLKGIKVNANATICVSGRPLRTEFGEVLFCDYGLSGPPILQISREVSRAEGNAEIWLDVMPDYDFGQVYDMIRARRNNLSYCNLDEFFTGMLNKRLGQVVLKTVGLKLNESVTVLDDKKCKEIAAILKKFQFKAIGTTGFLNSQVTAGGLDTKTFNSKTMESREAKGFYAVGEILDIDGDCGGFNLQWAWSSAFCASDNILKEKQ